MRETRNEKKREGILGYDIGNWSAACKTHIVGSRKLRYMTN
jgi:hypothetical protein